MEKRIGKSNIVEGSSIATASPKKKAHETQIGKKGKNCLIEFLRRKKKKTKSTGDHSREERFFWKANRKGP